MPCLTALQRWLQGRRSTQPPSSRSDRLKEFWVRLKVLVPEEQEKWGFVFRSLQKVEVLLTVVKHLPHHHGNAAPEGPAVVQGIKCPTGRFQTAKIPF